MVLGTSVIISFGHATEEIADSAGLLVDATDTGDLARAFGRLDRDNAAHEELYCACLKRALDFNFDICSQRMSLFYQNLGTQ